MLKEKMNSVPKLYAKKKEQVFLPSFHHYLCNYLEAGFPNHFS